MAFLEDKNFATTHAYRDLLKSQSQFAHIPNEYTVLCSLDSKLLLEPTSHEHHSVEQVRLTAESQQVVGFASIPKACLPYFDCSSFVCAVVAIVRDSSLCISEVHKKDSSLEVRHVASVSVQHRGRPEVAGDASEEPLCVQLDVHNNSAALLRVLWCRNVCCDADNSKSTPVLNLAELCVSPMNGSLCYHLITNIQDCDVHGAFTDGVGRKRSAVHKVHSLAWCGATLDYSDKRPCFLMCVDRSPSQPTDPACRTATLAVIMERNSQLPNSSAKRTQPDAVSGAVFEGPWVVDPCTMLCPSFVAHCILPAVCGQGSGFVRGDKGRQLDDVFGWFSLIPSTVAGVHDLRSVDILRSSRGFATVQRRTTKTHSATSTSQFVLYGSKGLVAMHSISGIVVTASTVAQPTDSIMQVVCLTASGGAHILSVHLQEQRDAASMRRPTSAQGVRSETIAYLSITSRELHLDWGSNHTKTVLYRFLVNGTAGDAARGSTILWVSACWQHDERQVMVSLQRSTVKDDASSDTMAIASTSSCFCWSVDPSSGALPPRDEWRLPLATQRERSGSRCGPWVSYSRCGILAVMRKSAGIFHSTAGLIPESLQLRIAESCSWVSLVDTGADALLHGAATIEDESAATPSLCVLLLADVVTSQSRSIEASVVRLSNNGSADEVLAKDIPLLQSAIALLSDDEQSKCSLAPVVVQVEPLPDVSANDHSFVASLTNAAGNAIFLLLRCRTTSPMDSFAPMGCVEVAHTFRGFTNVVPRFLLVSDAGRSMSEAVFVAEGKLVSLSVERRGNDVAFQGGSDEASARKSLASARVHAVVARQAHTEFDNYGRPTIENMECAQEFQTAFRLGWIDGLDSMAFFQTVCGSLLLLELVYHDPTEADTVLLGKSARPQPSVIVTRLHGSASRLNDPVGVRGRICAAVGSGVTTLRVVLDGEQRRIAERASAAAEEVSSKTNRESVLRALNNAVASVQGVIRACEVRNCGTDCENAAGNWCYAK